MTREHLGIRIDVGAYTLATKPIKMSGVPVLMDHRTIMDIGKPKHGWGKSLLSIYWDTCGFDNGTRTWISVNVFRQSFNLWCAKR
jgi:hypothetical protein